MTKAVHVLKFPKQFLLLFSGKLLVIMALILYNAFQKTNRKDPDQTASSEAV